MAYVNDALGVLAAFPNAFTLWHYNAAGDAIATVKGSGYFDNSIAGGRMMRRGDLILAVTDNNTKRDLLLVTSASGATPVTTVVTAT